jgi:hypothetical protein
VPWSLNLNPNLDFTIDGNSLPHRNGVYVLALKLGRNITGFLLADTFRRWFAALVFLVLLYGYSLFDLCSVLQDLKVSLQNRLRAMYNESLVFDSEGLLHLGKQQS